MAPFVGRVHEIETLRALMADPELRLITLVGPGGVGKTRLALQAAHGMTDVLRRAIHFVPLVAVASPMDIPIAIANALDASDGAARPLIMGIRAALRDRPTLIVLDNLEHLLPDAAGVVSELLAACPSLGILATSRAPLRVYGERRFSVRPLAVSVPKATATHPSGQEEPDAVRLFILRAQAVDPDLSLSSASRKDIVEICRKFDGLPLAIELAAPRAAELPPHAYLQRLAQNRPLPAGGSRDMPPRQQTMMATVEWSYQLLDPDQQAMFRRLAVFAGEFDLDAAEAMATDLVRGVTPGGDAVASCLDLLAGLVEASLVQRRTDAAGEPWYQMLETIRTYGLDHAQAEGEAHALHQRHAGYYFDLVAAADRELLTGRRLVHWLTWLDDRLPNIRSAMTWSHQHDPLLLAQFTRHLMQYWLRRSRMQEGIGWLRRAMEAAANLPEIERGWILANLGRLHQYTPDMGDSSWYEAALDIARAQDDRELQLAIHIGQALHALLTNHPDQARTALDAAMRVPDVQERALHVTQPTFLSAIEALVVAASGNLDRAGTLATQVLSRATREGDEIAPGLLHRILCNVEQARGDLESARAHTLMALETYDAVGEAWNVANCLVDLAELLTQQHPVLALRLAGAADRLLAIHGATRLHPDHEPYRSLVQTLRQQMGAEAVNAAWREGTSLPWRGILQEARTVPLDQDATLGTSVSPARPQGIGGTLSPREQEVLLLIADGLTDREIARTLGVTYRTITTYVSNILTKLDVPSRTAAVSRAARDGLLNE